MSMEIYIYICLELLEARYSILKNDLPMGWKPDVVLLETIIPSYSFAGFLVLTGDGEVHFLFDYPCTKEHLQPEGVRTAMV